MVSSQRPGFPARLPSRPSVTQTTNQSAMPAPSRPGSPAHGAGLDSGAARTRMVERLAHGGVRDTRVLQAFAQVPRHQFVDTALANQAYEDTSLPIGLGQTISKPSVVALMIGLLLEVAPQGRLGRVLEIGTGCGYQAAVLSQVATEVYSIERLKGLHDKARSNLRPMRIPNIHLLFADGMLGYAAGAPYAGIISAAGGDQLPACWIDQLAVGGRLVAPTAQADGTQKLLVVDKTARGITQRTLESVLFVPLKSGTA